MKHFLFGGAIGRAFGAAPVSTQCVPFETSCLVGRFREMPNTTPECNVARRCVTNPKQRRKHARDRRTLGDSQTALWPRGRRCVKIGDHRISVDSLDGCQFFLATSSTSC